MNEQLISPETAKLAKGRSFPQSDSDIQYTEDRDHDTGNRGQFILHERFSVVTQSLLQKWLREEHDIHIYIEPYDDGEYEPVIITEKCDEKDEEVYFKSYEDALENALQESLKLLEGVSDERREVL